MKLLKVENLTVGLIGKLQKKKEELLRKREENNGSKMKKTEDKD